MTRPVWTIASKEFKAIFSERTIVLAVIIQVFVAGFSSFLVVGLSALVDPEAFPTAARPQVATNGTDELARHLDAAGLETRAYESAAAALSAFDRGEVDAVALARRAPGEACGATCVPVSVTLVLPDGDLRATLTLVKVKAALQDWERSLRAEHADRLSVEPVYLDSQAHAGSYGFVYALLVPLLVLLPVVLAGALVADSITEEVQRGTLPLLLVTPATAVDVVEGKVLANVAIVPMLGALWFALLALNGLTVPLLGAVLVLVMGTAVAFAMGALACAIAFMTRDRNRTHVAYATAFFLAMGLSLELPMSPVNAIALLAGGSPSAGAYAVVLGSVALALACALGLRVVLHRVAHRLAAGV